MVILEMAQPLQFGMFKTLGVRERQPVLSATRGVSLNKILL